MAGAQGGLLLRQNCDNRDPVLGVLRPQARIGRSIWKHPPPRPQEAFSMTVVDGGCLGPLCIYGCQVRPSEDSYQRQTLFF